MAYFDNAATTFPKPDCVYEQMDRFYRSVGGSVGRGNYGIALSARELLNDTRNMTLIAMQKFKNTRRSSMSAMRKLQK